MMKNLHTRMLFVLAFFCLHYLSAQTVVDIVVNSADHTTLEAAVIAAELNDDLSANGPFTLFAPDDSAFNALPAGTVDSLLADPTGQLAQVLQYHVISGDLTAANLSDGDTLTTLEGQELYVTIDEGSVFINGAQVTTPDIDATNGTVHVVDQVLNSTITGIVARSEAHTTLETALVASELFPNLTANGDFTLFAPTDAAFNALPNGILDSLLNDPTGKLAGFLGYHVVSGEVLSGQLSDGQTVTTLEGLDLTVSITGNGVFINGAQVTAADLQGSNGVVHVIDKVLNPTITGIVERSPAHDTLEIAISASELYNTLTATGDYTLFAPADPAFAALPSDIFSSLLANPTEELAWILLHHTVAGNVMAADLSDGDTVTTLLGQELIVGIDGGTVTIGGATVTLADLKGSNGIVHVIDQVLIPDFVQVQESAEYGKILTDIFGNSLYYFTRDAGDTSNCQGGCLDAWPAFNANYLFLDEELAASDFDTLMRKDGSSQLRFKGWPLYYFANDQEPGDVNGDGANNIWFVAKPNYSIMLADNYLLGADGNVYNSEYEQDSAIVQYLVDGKGLTLYRFVNDFNNTNNFTAEDFSNNSTWPIYEEDSIVVPSNLNAADFEVIDVFGRIQLTYKGHPLYYFGSDNMERGSTKGVSVPQPGIWPVVEPDVEPATPETVVDIIVESENHTTLEAAVIAAELVDDLSAAGPFTVFAPTDAAFGALPDGALDDLLNDPTGELAQILLYHVVSGSVLSGDLSDGQMVTTLQGGDIEVTVNNDGVFINGAQVTVADLEAGNGVVHVIDAVLSIPNSVVDVIVNSENHTTLETAVTEAGLVETLSGDGPFTVFAPTDAAFDALPGGVLDGLLADPTGELATILQYHVASGNVLSTDLSDGMMITTLQGEDVEVTIDGGNVFINDAQVTMADIEADNGVVHVIDAVLSIPNSVVDVIVNSENHTTLETAVTEAGLVETLSGDGPFTVFAPTDAAFDALPEGTLADLLNDPTGQLATILQYHVASGSVLAGDLTDGMSITTLQGNPVFVEIDDGNVFINQAQVTMADIEADNGIVHVIDAVLQPQDGITAVQDRETEISIYPNPTDGLLQIFNPQGSAQQIAVLDPNGKVMIETQSSDKITELNLSTLPSSIYIIRVKTPQGVSTQRVSVQ